MQTTEPVDAGHDRGRRRRGGRGGAGCDQLGEPVGRIGRLRRAGDHVRDVTGDPVVGDHCGRAPGEVVAGDAEPIGHRLQTEAARDGASRDHDAGDRLDRRTAGGADVGHVARDVPAGCRATGVRDGDRLERTGRDLRLAVQDDGRHDDRALHLVHRHRRADDRLDDDLLQLAGGAGGVALVGEHADRHRGDIAHQPTEIGDGEIERHRARIGGGCVIRVHAWRGGRGERAARRRGRRQRGHGVRARVDVRVDVGAVVGEIDRGRLTGADADRLAVAHRSGRRGVHHDGLERDRGRRGEVDTVARHRVEDRRPDVACEHRRERQADVDVDHAAAVAELDVATGRVPRRRPECLGDRDVGRRDHIVRRIVRGATIVDQRDRRRADAVDGDELTAFGGVAAEDRGVDFGGVGVQAHLRQPDRVGGHDDGAGDVELDARRSQVDGVGPQLGRVRRAGPRQGDQYVGIGRRDTVDAGVVVRLGSCVCSAAGEYDRRRGQREAERRGDGASAPE